MQDLIKQEQFELEVLERLNSGRFLNSLVFTGGTMLRLCFGLNRFSIDLDFWMLRGKDEKKLFKDLKSCLEEPYVIKDCASKFHTLLFEIKSKDYPRSLKIEIRKEARPVVTQQAIAYSRHSNTQVLVKAMSLKEMMKAKIEAFLERKEIRDAFDLEFLLKKGIDLDAPQDTLKRVLRGIGSLTQKDFSVKLGSLLEGKEREYYRRENLKILESAIKEKLA